MRIGLLCLAAAVLLPAPAAAQNVPQDSLHSAITKALSLLEETSPTFIKKGGCNSCHNQLLASAAQTFARSRGVRTGPPIAQLAPEVSEASTERYVEYSIGGGGGINGLAYEFLAHALRNTPANERLRAQVHFIKAMQEPEGQWSGGAGRRPPLAFDDVTPTALMVLALDRYASPVDAADTAARISRARAWLLATTPDRTQEHAFKVMGLVWAKIDRAAVASAVAGLRAQQSANGGWSQLPGLEPDAYATGLALYAMHVGGVSTSDSAYQSGIKHLLSTQAADGTWHVRTRAIPFQPYFESGYPYGHDQWISAAGAAYAVLALAAAVEPVQSPRSASNASPLQGVWRIVQTSAAGPNGRTIDKTPPELGGIIVITAKHFAYVDVTADKPRPPLPQGGAVKATADELRATWGPFDAQAGTFEINGSESTQRVLVAKAPGLMQPGAFYVLSFKLEGPDTMVLTQVRNQAGPFANPVTFRAIRLE